MARRDGRPDEAAMRRLKESLEQVIQLAVSTSSAPVSRRIRLALGQFADELMSARATTDRIRLPSRSFDPFEPRTVGQMVALATLAQPLSRLSDVPNAYGSGVYAIYYVGDHPLYARISRTETPIYVGKADPDLADASTPREQGTRLTGRLKEHAGRIAAVEAYALSHDLPTGLAPIRLADFYCRRIVCATNAQLVAEKHLIRLFQPIWNIETKACWGLGKHGDNATTRQNRRSPWDVVHPGRDWALPGSLRDALTPAEIHRRIDETLNSYPPRKDHAALLEEMLAAFRQEDEGPAPTGPIVPETGANPQPEIQDD